MRCSTFAGRHSTIVRSLILGQVGTIGHSRLDRLLLIKLLKIQSPNVKEFAQTNVSAHIWALDSLGALQVGPARLCSASQSCHQEPPTDTLRRCPYVAMGTLKRVTFDTRNPRGTSDFRNNQGHQLENQNMCSQAKLSFSVIFMCMDDTRVHSEHALSMSTLCYTGPLLPNSSPPAVETQVSKIMQDA